MDLMPEKDFPRKNLAKNLCPRSMTTAGFSGETMAREGLVFRKEKKGDRPDGGH
jgi:hypothetical protein